MATSTFTQLLSSEGNYNLQALVYYILSLTTAVIGYATDLEKKKKSQLTEFFVGAQIAVNL